MPDAIIGSFMKLSAYERNKNRNYNAFIMDNDCLCINGNDGGREINYLGEIIQEA